MFEGLVQQVMVTTTTMPHTTMPPLDNPNCLQLKSIAHGSKASKKKSK
jgi:hypothetical protein